MADSRDGDGLRCGVRRLRGPRREGGCEGRGRTRAGSRRRAQASILILALLGTGRISAACTAPAAA